VLFFEVKNIIRPLCRILLFLNFTVVNARVQGVVSSLGPNDASGVLINIVAVQGI